MKNKLIDLNNHLFEQLERLQDEEITGEKLSEEIKRSKAMDGLASSIIDNANLALRAHTLINNGHVNTAPEMIGMRVSDEV